MRAVMLDPAPRVRRPSTRPATSAGASRGTRLPVSAAGWRRSGWRVVGHQRWSGLAAGPAEWQAGDWAGCALPSPPPCGAAPCTAGAGRLEKEKKEWRHSLSFFALFFFCYRTLRPPRSLVFALCRSSVSTPTVSKRERWGKEANGRQKNVVKHARPGVVFLPPTHAVPTPTNPQSPATASTIPTP